MIKSSNIENLTYVKETSEMEVTFKSGGVYVYENVDFEDFSTILEASSVGRTLISLRKEKDWSYRRIK